MKPAAPNLRRGSSRTFDQTASITLAQLSTILDCATRGLPADFLEPPGEQLNDLYLIVHSVYGLKPGAYFFRRERNTLELLKEGNSAPRPDLCGVASNGYLYTVGGVEFSSTKPNGQTVGYVQRAKFHHPVDGTIEAWTRQTGLGLPALQLHGTVVLNGYMYVIGGSTATDAMQATGHITAAVHAATIDPNNGSVGSFTDPNLIMPSLPIPIYKTCPIVVGNVIYMFGGETDGNHAADPAHPAVDAVYYATQDPNTGKLSPWTTAPYTIPLNMFVNPDADGLASQALVFVNTRGAVFMGGDSTGSGGDTNVVIKGANITNSTITWSFLAPIPGAPPQNTGLISRNAGATLNHYAYSVAGLYQSGDSKVVRCLLVP